MSKMERRLTELGYVVKNVGYLSRTDSIKNLSETTIPGALKSEELKGCSKIHFVTHSMGGILVRCYLQKHNIKNLGRVVMLAPPNQGSEVVDKIGCWKIVQSLNGPAGAELTTAQDSTPNQLGAINFECGIIAGDRSINWINSLMIPGKDDGKVSVERTWTTGVKAQKVHHVSHPYIMKRKAVIEDVAYFLKHGDFSK